MFDIGGWEFLVIVVLGIIVIGPKELPGAIRTVTMWVRKAKGLAREFQSGLDDIVREVELDKMKSEIESKVGMDDLKHEIESTVDPEGEMKEAFDFDEGDWYSDHMDEEDEDDRTPSIEDPARARPAVEGGADERAEVAGEAESETERDPAGSGTRT